MSEPESEPESAAKPRPKLATLASWAVIAVTLIYAAAFLDPFVAIAALPFFALGSARGKSPLTLCALALVPVLALQAASGVKFLITTLPLVTYDHYFLRGNVLVLAANDWRIASAVVLGALGTIVYLRLLFSGKGAFTRFEKAGVVGLAVVAVACLMSVRNWTSDVMGWDKALNEPTVRAFVRSAQIPAPQLDLLPQAQAALPAPTLTTGGLVTPIPGLSAPADKPDLFFILQESMLPPEKIRPGAEARHLFAKTADHVGPLRVHCFAGGTWKSEFSLAVQMRPQEFGNDGLYVFHQLEGRIKRSIFTLLKEQGYRVMVFYPSPGNFINGRNFYASIGVDELYDPEALGIGDGWDWKIPDATLYDAMLKKIEGETRPVAVLLLTISQHGPHVFEDPHTDYMTRFEVADAAYGKLLQDLAARGRRTGVVAFGDHQPEFLARFVDNHDDWYYTGYDVRCLNFECAPSVLDNRGGKPLDITLLSSSALQAFGFGLDGFAALHQDLYAHCGDDVAKCDETARLTLNSAFSHFFE
ncbi:MAG: sulfatase-like hydrolase/transferase [Rhodospirillaceae bacterium]|nr:sulfatase-like hydrolase/transferase [Rhodospirillaceae bacterium]